MLIIIFNIMEIMEGNENMLNLQNTNIYIYSPTRYTMWS